MGKRFVKFILMTLALNAYSQGIRINQVGFYPESEKLAAVVDLTVAHGDTFSIINAETNDVVFKDTLSVSRYFSTSEENVRIADFSNLETKGKYKVKIGNLESYTFEIKDSALFDVLTKTLRSYMYNRCSSGDLLKDPEIAGIWTRDGGHPDINILIHSSAGTDKLPAGKYVFGQKGWYDAGDYNKYVVNAGITTYTMLAMYEHHVFLLNHIHLNIPESGDHMPDILDEALWNIRWLQRMQDPYDGGVWHKLTSKGFGGDFLMPKDDGQSRYMVMKSTAATLDFAAVMAQAARVYKEFDWLLPGFADSCIKQAEFAWQWASSNPSVYYSQPTDISTGGYGDGNVSDEKSWAAAELYITTGKETYYNSVSRTIDIYNTSWNSVYSLAIQSLVFYENILSKDVTWAKNKLITSANIWLDYYKTLPYRSAFGSSNNLFWGSNAICGNAGITLMSAYYLTDDEEYYKAAMTCMDYVLGRNPTDYSFITGIGSKYPMNPHHRISLADGIVEPVPGMAVGGVNRNPTDNAGTYPRQSGKKFLDVYGSYATNEPAINYTIPFAYLSLAAEAHNQGLKVGLANKATEFDNSEIEISLFPNPASEIVQIRAKNTVQNISVFTVSGQFITNTHETTINLSSFEKGIYFLSIQTDAGTVGKKLIIE